MSAQHTPAAAEEWAVNRIKELEQQLSAVQGELSTILKAKTVGVTIPTATMECEFQAHYRQGYAAGIASRKQQSAELLAAAEKYANTWLIDERDDHDREVCINDEHYEDAQALFAAIAKAKATQ